MLARLSINRSIASLARGSFWALMGAMHAPALIASWQAYLESHGTTAELLGCVGVTASMAFFIAKLCGVRFLRIRPGKRGIVAICLIVALLHVGCLDSEPGMTFAAECATVLATATLIGCLAQAARVLSEVLRRRGLCHKSYRPGQRFDLTASHDGFRPHCWVLAYRLFGLRAPPACIP